MVPSSSSSSWQSGQWPAIRRATKAPSVGASGRESEHHWRQAIDQSAVAPARTSNELRLSLCTTSAQCHHRKGEGGFCARPRIAVPEECCRESCQMPLPGEPVTRRCYKWANQEGRRRRQAAREKGCDWPAARLQIEFEHSTRNRQSIKQRQQQQQPGDCLARSVQCQHSGIVP